MFFLSFFLSFYLSFVSYSFISLFFDLIYTLACVCWLVGGIGKREFGIGFGIAICVQWAMGNGYGYDVHFLRYVLGRLVCGWWKLW